VEAGEELDDNELSSKLNSFHEPHRLCGVSIVVDLDIIGSACVPTGVFFSGPGRFFQTY
jgi:hypothetical protein